MPDNLAAYFAQGSEKLSSGMDMDLDENVGMNEGKELPDYEDMGPSVSMAVHADSDDHFQTSTFNLKRTRSMGLLDPYIDDTQKLASGEE